MTRVEIRPRRAGRQAALLDAVAEAAATATGLQVFVAVDPALCRTLSARLGDLADVEHHEHAPRGVILMYPAGQVPAFRPAAETVGRPDTGTDAGLPPLR